VSSSGLARFVDHCEAVTGVACDSRPLVTAVIYGPTLSSSTDPTGSLATPPSAAERPFVGGFG
jgi:hypothetical protein